MLAHLHANPEALLFVEMGLGKTVVVLKYIDDLISSGESKGVLFCSPLRVKQITIPEQCATWRHSAWLRVVDMSTPEGEKAWKEGGADIYLTHYDVLASREVTRKCPKCKGKGCGECEGGYVTNKYPGFAEKFLKGRKTLPVDMVVYDECFPAGTLIDTPQGPTPIENLKKGSRIFNVRGQDTVVQTKRNQVNEAISIKTSLGEIITSRTHKFFTLRGWVRAEHITKADSLVPTVEAMRLLRKKDSRKSEESQTEILREALLRESNSPPTETSPPSSIVRMVLERIYAKGRAHSSLLWTKMLGLLEDEERPPTSVDPRENRASLREKKGLVRFRLSCFGERVGADHRALPDEQPRIRGEVEGDLEKNWAQTARPRGERATPHPPSENPTGFSWAGVGARVSDWLEALSSGVSDLLQSGPRSRRVADCNRSGRGESQQPPRKKHRREERCKVEGVRVDRTEVLKQGDPRLEQFRDADGLIYFYDLEILGHPSYSVNGLLVHNCSKFKAHNGTRATAMRAYHHLIPRKVGMTGSPLGNSRLNIFNQVRMIDGGKRLGPSFHAFRQRYAESDYMGYKWEMRPGAAEKIDEKIADIALVLLNKDHANLPPCYMEDIEVTMPAAAVKQYLKIEKELLLELEKGDIVALNAAVLANKMLQITGGACYGDNKEVHVLHTAKIEAVKKLRKTLGPKEPLIVLASFKHETARLLEAIPGSKVFHKDDMAAWQKGKIHTIIADARSIGFGVDGLQRSCTNMLFFTPYWSAEVVQQVIKRIHRHGNLRDTHIHRLIATIPNKVTIDEIVIESNRANTEEQETMMKSLKALQRINKK